MTPDASRRLLKIVKLKLRHTETRLAAIARRMQDCQSEAEALVADLKEFDKIARPMGDAVISGRSKALEAVFSAEANLRLQRQALEQEKEDLAKQLRVLIVAEKTLSATSKR